MTEGPRPGLRRNLSLTHVVLYGVGTTVGAGIYLLIGEVAKISGLAAPSAFLASSVLAAFTALSFGELSSRFPQSAGEAVYVREGFGRRDLATSVGLLVAAAGCISAAAMANGFAAYLSEFIEVPKSICVTLFVLAMVGIAIWGVAESVSIAGVITLIEVGGLVVLVWVAGDSLVRVPDEWTALLPVFDPDAWHGVGAACLLTFYAFLGFEDMVNVAEEVKNVRRVLPLAIGITLAVTTVLYVLLATVCVLAVTPAELGESTAPLAFVFERVTGRAPTGIAIVGILAVVNGALIQTIMASRILFGLASRGQLVPVLARIHPKTRTPHVATLVAGVAVLGLALWLPLAPLAEGTAFVTLVVFATVNLALLRIKRDPARPAPVFSVPIWVPIVGASTTIGLLGLRIFNALAA
jgi:APA family basic amino acid/polyamine antiporter